MIEGPLPSEWFLWVPWCFQLPFCWIYPKHKGKLMFLMEFLELILKEQRKLPETWTKGKRESKRIQRWKAIEGKVQFNWLYWGWETGATHHFKAFLAESVVSVVEFHDLCFLEAWKTFTNAWKPVRLSHIPPAMILLLCLMMNYERFNDKSSIFFISVSLPERSAWTPFPLSLLTLSAETLFIYGTKPVSTPDQWKTPSVFLSFLSRFGSQDAQSFRPNSSFCLSKKNFWGDFYELEENDLPKIKRKSSDIFEFRDGLHYAFDFFMDKLVVSVCFGSFGENTRVFTKLLERALWFWEEKALWWFARWVQEPSCLETGNQSKGIQDRQVRWH